MCGIFGYVGPKNGAAEKILDGLKALEYRGYDSWGVAVVANNAIKIERKVGKIGDATVSLPDSNIGIGPPSNSIVAPAPAWRFIRH
jgi:glucosamine--fructose-6-phosphate aminotransferase (isomerizing)